MLVGLEVAEGPGGPAEVVARGVQEVAVEGEVQEVDMVGTQGVGKELGMEDDQAEIQLWDQRPWMAVVVGPVGAYRNAEVGKLRHVLRERVPRRSRLEHREESVEPKRLEEGVEAMEEEEEEEEAVVLELIHHLGCLAHLGDARSIGPGQGEEDYD